jgi:putative endonuclease
MDSHNIYSKKGYTPKFRPWEILFTEDYETKQEALKRENANERKFILKVAKDKYILK